MGFQFFFVLGSVVRLIIGPFRQLPSVSGVFVVFLHGLGVIGPFTGQRLGLGPGTWFGVFFGGFGGQSRIVFCNWLCFSVYVFWMWLGVYMLWLRFGIFLFWRRLEVFLQSWCWLGWFFDRGPFAGQRLGFWVVCAA